MSIRGGAVITQAGVAVLDRVQSVGPGDLSIPEEKIDEVGNWKSVATVYDTPELTYDIESYDVSTEFEATLIGSSDPTNFPDTIGNNEIDLNDAVPIDIISLIKSQRNRYDIVNGAVVPALTLSNATYRFGVGENATQSFTLNTDSVFYTPGAPFYEEFTFTPGDTTYTISRTADKYTDLGGDVYILSVMLYDTATGKFKRVFFDSEAILGTPASTDSGYSNNATGFRLPDSVDDGAYDRIRVTYSSSITDVDYDPNTDNSGLNPNGEPIHVNASILPAAVRGKDIAVFIGSTDPTPVFTKLTSVQNFEVSWSVTLENDQEMGNSRFVAQEYDVPEVSGTMGVLPYDPADMMDKLVRITGVTAGEVIGPNINQPVPVEIRVYHPTSKAQLKTFYIPDARFTVPGFNAQVQTKMEQSLPFSSDTGTLLIYNGSRTV